MQIPEKLYDGTHFNQIVKKNLSFNQLWNAMTLLPAKFKFSSFYPH
uniref:Uncharacterized protein n=1 Tax=Rhizophora mucronata TaxID=61149 RepID=A0A2P2NF58_RHIMU